MSLENKKSADEVTSTTSSQSKSQTSNKFKRAQKINWTNSDEKETYSTVVVNYHYPKIDKNQSQPQRSTGAISKKRNTSTWSKMLSVIAPSSKESIKSDSNNNKNNNDSNQWHNLNDDDDDVPNLSKLYNSKEELTTDSKDKKHQTKTENIKVEIYCVPQKQQAIIEEPLLKKMQELRTLNESVAGLAAETETDDINHFIVNTVQKAKAPQPFRLDPDIIILSDDNEDGDDEADEGSDKTKVDEAQQTNRINNKTKATQNPEPKPTKKTRTRGDHANSAATSSNTDSNNNVPKYKEMPGVENSAYNLKVKVPSQSNYKQRQLELHRYRIAVEQKRLELLEVKLARERDEMLREQMLFDKELEMKRTQLKQIISDIDNDDKL